MTYRGLIVAPFLVFSPSLWGQQVVRVSSGVAGAQGNKDSYEPSISADGRNVAFISAASNLVAGDTNEATDIFVHDRLHGVTTRVSLGGNGLPANGNSLMPSISADGRYVAFMSDASNLVGGDTNGVGDVFVRDLLAGTTVRVSVGPTGEQANGGSLNPVMTPDGRFVAFDSSATNLVALDANGHRDVFIRELLGEETLLVSIDSNGVQVAKDSYQPSISADGRRVAIQTQARFSPLDSDRFDDVYVRDLQAGTLSIATISSTGVKANLGGGLPSISAAGDRVVFASSATNLVADDDNGKTDIFIHDLSSGRTTRESLTPEFGESDGFSYSGSLSSDGRFLLFSSDAPDLIANDTNGVTDLFLRDLMSGGVVLINASSRGRRGDSQSFVGALSADGRHVAFDSASSNLVPHDDNGFADVFVLSFTKFRFR